SEEEQTVFRRGRNAKGVSIPKSCTPSEYRKATGFEALIGYLHLQGKNERITEIITYGIEQYKENK
ncbi:MAG: ribonuclease III, partial [Lachnospiraceae bacterium]|nr:ribonuclease III [Lachnospiraceae bacterium]